MMDAAGPARGYRYEVKFVVEGLDIHHARALLRTHPACFSEVYPPRYVNNIYFDTVVQTAYWHNLAGAADRAKLRIRWYGKLFGAISRPVLEYKIKRGSVGTKLAYPLPPFRLDTGFSQGDLMDIIQSAGSLPAEVRRDLTHLRVALLNRYYRAYFATPDRRFRVTLDSELTFYRICCLQNTFAHRQIDRRHLIVELKYDAQYASEAHRIASRFPFRATRNSKYVAGIQRVGR
jgi:SPX domain protein involved in polyphosphate accumulation